MTHYTAAYYKIIYIHVIYQTKLVIMAWTCLDYDSNYSNVWRHPAVDSPLVCCSPSLLCREQQQWSRLPTTETWNLFYKHASTNRMGWFYKNMNSSPITGLFSHCFKCTDTQYADEWWKGDFFFRFSTYHKCYLCIVHNKVKEINDERSLKRKIRAQKNINHDSCCDP